jgi:serine/threonine protein kinase
MKLVGFRLPQPVMATSVVWLSIGITELMPNDALEAVLKDEFTGKPKRSFGPRKRSKAIFTIPSVTTQGHRHSAVHHDLKPANIFLNEN